MFALDVGRCVPSEPTSQEFPFFVGGLAGWEALPALWGMRSSPVTPDV